MPALNDLVFNFIGKATIYPSPDRRSEVLKQVLKFCPINTAFQCVGHKNLRWQYSHDVSLESIVLFAFYKTIYMTCFGVIHSGSKNDWERAWTMNFVKLGAGVALNLDSVASITWEGRGTRLVAKVRYLIPSPKGAGGEAQLVSEKFTGDAAQTLYKYLSEQPGRIQSAKVQRATESRATTPNNPAPAEPLDLLADQLGTQKKGWYYVEDSKGRGYFIALINAKGSCSMRTFDAETGRFLGKRYQTNASYQENFLPQLNKPRELSVNEQPNLERDCRHQLPQNILSHLKDQVC